MSGRVSFLITAYNEEEFIENTVKSVLSQTYPDIEVIVVDDGSMDTTSRIVEGVRSTDRRCKLIRFESNRGKAAAQNAAFHASTGDYIAILGGDDIAESERAECQVEFIEKHGHDFVYSNASLLRDKGNGDFHLNGLHYSNKQVIRHGPLAALRGQSFIGGTVMMTRSLAARVFPLPAGLPYEDRWFSALAAIYGSIGYDPRPLTQYRQHGGNTWGVDAARSFKAYRKKMHYLMHRERIYDARIEEYLSTYLRPSEELSRCIEAHRSLREGHPLLRRMRLALVYRTDLRMDRLVALIHPDLSILVRWGLRRYRHAKRAFLHQ